MQSGSKYSLHCLNKAITSSNKNGSDVKGFRLESDIASICLKRSKIDHSIYLLFRYLYSMYVH